KASSKPRLHGWIRVSLLLLTVGGLTHFDWKVLAGLPPATPASASAAVEFNRDIRPILSHKCFKCRGPAQQEGGVRLDLRERAIKKGAIVPGKSDESELVYRIEAEDDERMPP